MEDSLQRSFERPQTIEEATGLLEKHGAAARPLAGGTDLLVQMRGGVKRPSVLVDLKGIDELMRFEIGANEIVIGAAHSTAALRENAELVELLPGLMEAAELIGSEQIQGRASIGGNLCNASPAADTGPAAAVVGAVCEIAGPEGRRSLPVTEFVTGPGTTALGAGEILVALRIPRPPARAADAYLRFIPRTEMDIAVVGVGAWVRLDADGSCAEVRLSLGAVGPTVLAVDVDALVGRPIDDAALATAAAAASATARPIDDKRGTVAYRKHVSGVLAKRALRIAADRAAARS
jgi:carbon-monoxide dehydrogenase medium subunit